MVQAALLKPDYVFHQGPDLESCDDAQHARRRRRHRVPEPTHRAGSRVPSGDAGNVEDSYSRGSAASRLCASISQAKLAAYRKVPALDGAALRLALDPDDNLAIGASRYLPESRSAT